MNWREYQIKTAEFFSGIGLHTEIECEVVGVRGKHEIDVYAAGEFSGIEFKWVIECKAWKTNIPKEKVLALSAIVQDVGADRGFLMSEVGFQSGAIRSSQTSNITLTSIEDLSAITASFATNTLMGKTAWEVLKAKNRLLEIKKKSEAHEYNVERTMLFGELGIIEMMLHEAAENKYPILYPTKGLEFYSFSELIKYANDYIVAANKWDI